MKISTKSYLFLFLSFLSSVALGNYQVSLKLKPDPPEVGENKIEIAVKDESGKAAETSNVKLLIKMPAMGTMAGTEEKAKIKSESNGLFVGEFELAFSGTWELELSIEKDKKVEMFNYSLTTGVSGLTDKNLSKRSHEVSTSETTKLLSIGPDRLQKIGVRFVDVKNLPLMKILRTVGVIEADDTRRTEMTLRFSGYIEKQFVGRIGDFIKAGSPLFSVYSPELMSAQSEFLLNGSHPSNFHSSARERLQNFGLSENDIEKIKSSGKAQHDIVIHAPQSGTILDISVKAGSSFAQGQVLYTIADLSKNYIVSRVFQRDLTYLKVGQTVNIFIPEKEESVPGTVDLIFPNIREGEGTASVRVVALSPIERLRPGNYVDLRFSIDLGSHLSVPNGAILYSGLHKYVFVDRGEGSLEPREITTSESTGDMSEVSSGLKEGERVVASGAFLIGSEAQLRSALPKWKGEPKK